MKQSVLNFVYYLPSGVWLSIDTFDSVREELQSLVYLEDDTKSSVRDWKFIFQFEKSNKQ